MKCGNTMRFELIQLTREELYHKVWEKPIVKVASELGISDRGLAKCCLRHQIPFPGRGYWSKVKVGEKIEQKPLLIIKNDDTDKNQKIVFRRKISSDISLPEVDKIQKAIEEENYNKSSIILEESSLLSHPITIKLQKLISSKTDKMGCLKSKKGFLKSMIVTQNSLSKALQILDKFFIHVEVKGHSLILQKDKLVEIELYIYEERYSIRLIEEIKTDKPTKVGQMSHQEYWEYINTKWNYWPTGKLRIEAKGEHGKNSISDTKKNPIQNRFHTLLINLYNASIKSKQIREEHAQWRRDYEEKRRIWELEDKRRELYKKRVEIVKNVEQQWSRVNKLKEFHSALQDHFVTNEFHQDKKEKLIFILDWLQDCITNNDPLNSLDTLIEDFGQDIE